MAKRSKIDWETIEKEYRAGQVSNVQIGKDHDVSETAIRKRAKKFGWEKDLSHKVRERVREKLVRAEVRTPNANDDEIVEEMSDRGVKLVNLHRKDIAALRELEAGLIAELSGNPTKLYITQYQGNIIQQTVGLTAYERSAAANNLANVQHKRIALERESYNLDEKGASIEDVLAALPEPIRSGVRRKLIDAVS